jgi:hypothetical protein
VVYDFLLSAIHHGRYFEAFLIIAVNLAPWFVSFTLGCMILKIKNNWFKISIVIIVGVFYDFLGKPFIPIEMNTLVVIGLIAGLFCFLSNAWKDGVLKCIWTTIIIIIANALGTVFMAPFLLSKNGIEFITKTSEGFLIGTAVETIFPTVALILLYKFKNVNLIPKLFDKFKTGITSIVTYGSMLYLVYYAGIKFYLLTDYTNIFNDLVLFVVSTILIVAGHFRILSMLQKRHADNRRELEEKIVELEKLKNGGAWQEYVSRELANTTARLQSLIEMKNSVDETSGSEQKKKHHMERIK